MLPIGLSLRFFGSIKQDLRQYESWRSANALWITTECGYTQFKPLDCVEWQRDVFNLPCRQQKANADTSAFTVAQFLPTATSNRPTSLLTLTIAAIFLIFAICTRQNSPQNWIDLLISAALLKQPGWSGTNCCNNVAQSPHSLWLWRIGGDFQDIPERLDTQRWAGFCDKSVGWLKADRNGTWAG